ncbi:MAG: thiamine pyrophosphate-dependent enzyme [Clostridia bacterium]|nr:thiamine pyrophosphate-dependent enzyme [Clostridia bacterium]
MAELRLPKRLDGPAAWCPGCGHGLVVRLIAEVIDELDIGDRTIGCEDVACGAYESLALHIDTIGSAHGRPIPVANGIKGARPDAIVFAHLGDGSAYAIGCAELVHIALRGDNITAIVVNNTTYGMTGGQMAPTTLPDQKCSTARKGKDADRYGVLGVEKIIGNLNCSYLARGEIYDVASIAKTKSMIKKAFQNQIDGKGFSLVEVLAPCPTNLHMTPLQCKEYMHNEATKYFPVGVFVDK